MTERTREYIIEVKITEDSEYHNKTIEEAGLRSLKGLYIVELIRGDTSISPVTGKTVVKTNDLLILTGNTDTIADMVENSRNLQPSQLGMFSKRLKTEMLEVVITQNSKLLTKQQVVSSSGVNTMQQSLPFTGTVKNSGVKLAIFHSKWVTCYY